MPGTHHRPRSLHESSLVTAPSLPQVSQFSPLTALLMLDSLVMSGLSVFFVIGLSSVKVCRLWNWPRREQFVSGLSVFFVIGRSSVKVCRLWNWPRSPVLSAETDGRNVGQFDRRSDGVV